MTAYTNEEYYDMLMALGECHGQYHVTARRYAESYPNRIKQICRLAVYLEQLRGYTRLTVSFQINTILEAPIIKLFLSFLSLPKIALFTVIKENVRSFQSDKRQFALFRVTITIFTWNIFYASKQE
ncbi:hypothetical protein ACFW04_013270 [Cataglyphis niger]